MNFLSKITSKKFLTFAVGAVTGLILPPVVKSKAARKAAVTVTAKGMQLKDDARSTLETIKEDAQDVYAEAREMNKNEPE